MWLKLTSLTVQRIQESILEVLMDVRHERISSLLPTPLQFKEELSKIILYFTSLMQIPEYGNLAALYKLMSMKAGIAEKT